MIKILLLTSCLTGCFTEAEQEYRKDRSQGGQYYNNSPTKCKGGVLYYSHIHTLAPVYDSKTKEAVLCED